MKKYDLIPYSKMNNSYPLSVSDQDQKVTLLSLFIGTLISAWKGVMLSSYF